MQEIILFAVGIIVGIMNAIAGGGMLIGFPVLLATGLSPLAANMTSSLVVLPGQLTSAYGYRKYLRKLPGRYLLLIIPCFVGGYLGATILRNTSDARFSQIVPGLIIFAVLLFAFQPLLQHHLKRHIKRRSRSLRSLLLIALFLLPVTIYAGYFGPGFGFIMLAFLSFANLQDIHQMNGLKNVAGVCIASAAIIALYSTHMIDWRLGLAMGAGNGLGGYVGSRFSQRFSSHIIRIVVITIGLSAAIYLAMRTY